MTLKPTTRTILTALTALLTFVSMSCFLLKTDERVEVIISATDIVARKQITEPDITIIEIPVSAITKDMPRKTSQVVGHITKVSISRGKQILLSNLE
jgi:flagella basal body P-ring formation protein FlgA